MPGRVELGRADPGPLCRRRSVGALALAAALALLIGSLARGAAANPWMPWRSDAPAQTDEGAAGENADRPPPVWVPHDVRRPPAAAPNPEGRSGSSDRAPNPAAPPGNGSAAGGGSAPADPDAAGQTAGISRDSPLLSGRPGRVPAQNIDRDSSPWSALVEVTGPGGRCTGVAIGARTVAVLEDCARAGGGTVDPARLSVRPIAGDLERSFAVEGISRHGRAPGGSGNWDAVARRWAVLALAGPLPRAVSQAWLFEHDINDITPVTLAWLVWRDGAPRIRAIRGCSVASPYAISESVYQLDCIPEGEWKGGALLRPSGESWRLVGLMSGHRLTGGPSPAAVAIPAHAIARGLGGRPR